MSFRVLPFLQARCGRDMPEMCPRCARDVADFRVLPFLQHSRALGPLVGVIIDMMQLLAIFLVVMSIVFAGFAVGLHGLLANYLSGD